MNTKGHHSVANTAGLPLLREARRKALEKARGEVDPGSDDGALVGSDQGNLDSFYLGNWLTDISQMVDPVSLDSIAKTLSGELKSVSKGLASFVKDREEDLISAERGLARIVEYIAAGVWFGPPGTFSSENRAQFVSYAAAKTKQLERKTSQLSAEAQNAIVAGAEAMAKALTEFLVNEENERGSPMALFLRDTAFLVGYFKFVHPTEAPTPKLDHEAPTPKLDYSGYAETGYFKFVHPTEAPTPKLDYEAPTPKLDYSVYAKIFSHPDMTDSKPEASQDSPGSFTQYYPHEHLDRPEHLPAENPPRYFSESTQLGENSGTDTSKTNAVHPNPDLYTYLRDCLEMTAGLLAEVDIDLASILEGKGKISLDDCKVLAKLGHALHQVEDFFAHSNWVELAVAYLGPKYFEKQFPASVGNDYIDRARTLYRRRLKKLTGAPTRDWTENPEETWVVTGFFDSTGVVISLAHVMEEFLGLDAVDPYQKLHKAAHDPEAAVKEKLEGLHRKFRECLELISDYDHAIEDAENSVTTHLKKKYGKALPGMKEQLVPSKMTEEQALKIVNDLLLLDGVKSTLPEVVLKCLTNTFISASTTVGKGIAAFNIYKLVRSLAQFVKNPAGWALGWLGEIVGDELMDAALFYSLALFHHHIGADRIGCHSLLAKDHGGEPLYDWQKECATAVHWYIVKTLLRDRASQPQCIDWLELIEHFLRNPLPGNPVSHPLIREDYGVLEYSATVDDVFPKTYPKWTSDQLKRNQRATFGNVSNSQMGDLEFAACVEKTLESKAWSEVYVDKPRPTNGPLPSPEFKGILNVTDPVGNVGKAWKTKNYRETYLMRPDNTFVRVKDESFWFWLGPLVPWFAHVFDTGWKVFLEQTDPITNTVLPTVHGHQLVSMTEQEHADLIERGKMLRQGAREYYRPNKDPASK